MEKKLLVMFCVLHVVISRDALAPHGALPVVSDSHYQVVVPQVVGQDIMETHVPEQVDSSYQVLVPHAPASRVPVPYTPRHSRGRQFSRNFSRNGNGNGNGNHSGHDSLSASATVSPGAENLVALLDFQPSESLVYHNGNGNGSRALSIHSGVSSAATSAKDPSLRIPSDYSSYVLGDHSGMPVDSNWSSLRSENEDDLDARLDEFEEHFKRNNLRYRVYMARLGTLENKVLEKQEMLSRLRSQIDAALRSGANRIITPAELERTLKLLQEHYDEISRD